MKLLSFGSLNLDYVYGLSSIVSPGQTVFSGRRDCFPGGKGLNQTVAIARAGVPVFAAGCVGADGALLSDLLKTAGADCRYLKTVDAPTGHAVIQVAEDGENAIIVFAGANGCVDEKQIDSVLTDFSQGDYLTAQNEISCLPYLLKAAHRKGMRVFFNPSPLKENLSEVDFSDVDTIFVNRTEAKELFGTAQPEELRRLFGTSRFPRAVVLTLGKEGSAYLTKDVSEFCPAVPVHAVDTTGAGDTFAGYFISSRARGLSPREALMLANRAAALEVTRAGAAVSIPTYDEVIKEF